MALQTRENKENGEIGNEGEREREKERERGEKEVGKTSYQ